MNDSRAQKPPSQDAVRMAEIIKKMASDLDVATLCVLWDKTADTPAILFAENIQGGYLADGRGGFVTRFCHAILSQDDICDAMLHCVLEVASGIRGTTVENFPPDPLD